jgi:hypothetical protein
MLGICVIQQAVVLHLLGIVLERMNKHEPLSYFQGLDYTQLKRSWVLLLV